MKKFRKIIVRVLLVLLLLLGLALIFNEQIKSFMVGLNQDEKIAQVSKEAIKKAKDSPGDFDFSKVRSISLGQIAQSRTGNNAQVLGVLAIPDVNMRLPILKGLSDAALSSGGGTMRPDQVMGEGNYPLAGHYMTNKGILFSPLEQTKLGEKVYLTDLDYVYQYKITMKEKVDPTAVWLVNDTPEKIVTLITCADGGVRRWAVRGAFVSKEPATKKTLKIFKLQNLVD